MRNDQCGAETPRNTGGNPVTHPRDTEINAPSLQRFEVAKHKATIGQHNLAAQNLFELEWCWEEIAQLNAACQLLEHLVAKAASQ